MGWDDQCPRAPTGSTQIDRRRNMESQRKANILVAYLRTADATERTAGLYTAALAAELSMAFDRSPTDIILAE